VSRELVPKENHDLEPLLSAITPQSLVRGDEKCESFAAFLQEERRI